MERSDSIAALTKALVAFQGTISSVPKTRLNPFFKSKYADLDAIWEMCRKPLSANGLALVQTTVEEGSGGFYLETTLLHESGEYVQTRLPLNPAENTPQAVGSAITYARRYSMSALLGVAAEEDDDAEQAMSRQGTSTESQQQARTETRPCPVQGCDGLLRLNRWNKWSHGTSQTTPDGKRVWHSFSEGQVQHPANPTITDATLARTKEALNTAISNAQEGPQEEQGPVSESGGVVQGFENVGQLMAQVNKEYGLTTAQVLIILGIEYLGGIREAYPVLSVAWEKIVAAQG